jgi:hypothetical protein
LCSRLKVSLKYVTNFNPNFLLKPDNLTKNFDRNTNNGRVNCKNFILFILLLKNIFKKNKIAIFTKPKQSSIHNILRAPYKNKMSKHQITLSRFNFNITVSVDLKKAIDLKNTKQVVKILDCLKTFYSFFESNVCFQHRSNIAFKFLLNNYFLI